VDASVQRGERRDDWAATTNGGKEVCAQTAFIREKRRKRKAKRAAHENSFLDDGHREPEAVLSASPPVEEKKAR